MIASSLFNNLKIVIPMLIGIAFCLLHFLFLDDINVPHFWDDAWVYAPALQQMADNGPSLWPGTLDPYVYRGHPMMFHFLGGIWVNIFGPEALSLHLFALLISLLTLVSFYFVLSKWTGLKIASFATILLGSQEIFLAQSTLVLPEMMLGLFGLWSFYFLIERKIWLFALSASFFVLTKESALVFIFCYYLIFILRSRFKTAELVKVKNLILLIPCVVIALFLIIQKIEMGWFLFPEHLGMLKSDPETVRNTYKGVFNHLFEYQGRSLVAYTSMILFLLVFPNFNWPKRLLTFFLGFSLVKISFGQWSINPSLDLIICSIGALGLLSYLAYETIKVKEEEWLILFSILLCSILFTAFSTFNFFTPRYLLISVILIISFLAVIAFKLPAKFKNPALLLFPLITVISIISYSQRPRSMDFSIGWRNAVKANTLLVDRLNDLNAQNSKVFASFMHEVILNSVQAGYVEVENQFKSVSSNFEGDEKLIVLNNYYQHQDIQSELENKFHSIDTIEVEQAQIVLYSKSH